MKTQRKFEDVDIISTLRKIMLHNTQNYQTDFEYDIKMLTDAAQSKTANRSFLWMSRDNGTWCFPARDVYIGNTPSNHTWSYYSYLDNVKAFWIELDGETNGVVTGNIVELDYQKHVEDVSHNSHRPTSVEILFSNPNHVRTFDILDYNEVKQSILARYGQAEKMEYKVDDEYALNHMLDATLDHLFRKAKSNDIDAYVKEMEREYFHNYGYTKGGMAFTTPADADNALRRGLPVYALHHDGSAVQIAQKKELADHIYAGGIFGMSEETKSFLGYLTAVQPDKAPFTKDELDLLYRSVVFAGEGNDALSAGELKHMENLMFKLDTILDRPGEPDMQNVREDKSNSAFLQIQNSAEFQQRLSDTLLEEACRQWCCFIDEAPERLDGEGFAYFHREICEQKAEEYTETILDEMLEEARTPYEQDSQLEAEGGMEV